MEWKEVILGEITNLVIDYRGKTPLKLGSSWSDSGYRALSAKNIKTGQIVAEDSIRFVDEELYRKWMKDEVKKGDILITSEAPFGQIYYWDSDEKIVLSQRLFDVRLNDEVCHKYVYYFMTSHRYQKDLEGRATGTTVTGLRQPELLKSTILLPPLSAQRSISSILSSLDRKIELNNKINADLEEMAQAIFKNWFVDFEPFKDGKFVDSELGMIPEGWKIGTLTDVIKLMPGGTPKTSEPLYWDNGTIPFFSPKDVNGVYCFTTEKHITETGLNKCSSNLYPKDTIFITCRGTVGKVCLAACDMAMNQSNYAIKAIDGYSQCYVFFLVKSVVERLIKKSNGAVFSAITSKDFDEEILIPSQKAVEDFTNVIDGFFRRIFTIGTENSRLSTLRDTLLPRLMSGELEVPE